LGGHATNTDRSCTPWQNAGSRKSTAVVSKYSSSGFERHKNLNEGGRFLLGFEGLGDGYVRVSITDKGPGITGASIGLTVTKLLAKALNARLGVKIDVAKGSSFWIVRKQSASEPNN
jgi:hypothetical protein